MEANTIKVIASAVAGMLAAFLAPLAPYALLCTVMVLADVVSAWQLGRRMRRKGVASAAGRMSSRRFGRVVGTLAKCYGALAVAALMQKYVVESNDGLLARLPVPFRVNCVLYKDYPAQDLIPYLERFKKVPGASIQFRFDYTATTPENLYEEEGDKILQDLKKIARYTGLDGCRMRCGFHFDYQGMELTYHKTLPYSTIVETDPADGVTYDILYDILIKQNGDIHGDWDGTPLDVEAYEKVVFEPYDLKWLARIA